MSTTVAVLEAQLRADTSQFDRNIGQSESKMGKASRGIQKGALIAGAAIATGLGVAAKIGWDEFNQGQKVAAQTNAVIKSTGGVANVTAGHVSDLAESLMKKSGVDDEAIATGQNMLLTFKQIRNEAGAGNDIFDQATKATLDLSVAMGKDMADSSIMVGKALNDPIKGITAMRRVGIQFTEAQEDQIKKMVESGNVMGAQKLILRELESQFGGSAAAAGKTFGGQINILRESFNNLMGEIVGRVIPRLMSLAGFFRDHTTILKLLIGTIAGLVVGMIAFTVALKVYRAAVVTATALQWLWNVALTANPIGLVIAGIVAFGVALVVAYRKSETFRKVVHGAIDFVKKHWRLLLTAMFPLAGLFVMLWQRSQTFRDVVRGALDVVRGAIDRVHGALGRMRDFLSFVRNTARFTFEFFRDKAQLVIDKVGAVIQKLRDMVSYIKSIPGKIKDALGGIGGFFSDLGAGIGGATRGLRQGVGDFGSFGLGATSLVALGRQLQSMGFHVAEHPSFGGVSGGHAPGSYHYAGRAIDINWPGGGAAEMAKLDWLNSRLSRMPGVKELLWRTAGHFDHLHLAMAKGGIFTKPWTGMVSVAERGRPEGFVPLPAGGRGLGGLTLNFNAPVYGANESRLAEEIYRLYRRGEAAWLRGNGG